MPVLTILLVVPTAAGLACLVVRSRRLMAALGVAAFLVTLAAGDPAASGGARRAAP